MGRLQHTYSRRTQSMTRIWHHLLLPWLACLWPSGGAIAQRPPVLAIISSVTVEVPEPSDLCLIHGGASRTFFIASDNGFLVSIDTKGKLLKRSSDVGIDLEACMLHDGTLIAVDETQRRVIWCDTATLAVERSLTVPYSGGRNKGYESVAWNGANDRMVLITERDPVLIRELDSDMRITNEVMFDRSVRDISSALFHDGWMWLLSDEDRRLMRCDPRTYAILDSWTLPIINPEGFAFGDDGMLWVVSDDRQRLYSFRFPAGT